MTSTTPARSTTCAPCTSKTISDGIIRGEPGSFIFLDRSLKGEQFGKLAVFRLGKPGVEVLRSRVCAATGQIAAPGHRPDRLPLGLCIVESSPIRYPVTRGCLKVTLLVIQAYNGTGIGHLRGQDFGFILLTPQRILSYHLPWLTVRKVQT